MTDKERWTIAMISANVSEHIQKKPGLGNRERRRKNREGRE